MLCRFSSSFTSTVIALLYVCVLYEIHQNTEYLMFNRRLASLLLAHLNIVNLLFHGCLDTSLYNSAWENGYTDHFTRVEGIKTLFNPNWYFAKEGGNREQSHWLRHRCFLRST